MRARHLSSDHRLARLGGVLAIALGVGLLAFVVTSDEVDDGGSSDLATPTTDATVLGEVIEGTTLPDAPPASAVGFTTTTEQGAGDAVAGGSGGDGGGTTDPTIGPPVSFDNPTPTIGPPTSIVRPTTTTTAPTTTSSTTTTTESTTTTEPTTTSAP